MNLTLFWREFCRFALTLAGLLGGLSPLFAQGKAPIDLPGESYADLADLADSTPLILRAEIRKIVQLDAKNSDGTLPSQGRFYVEARTKSLLFGTVPVGESLRYLIDLPLDSRGKPPSLKKKAVLLFTAPVAGRTGDVQLVTRQAQVLWSMDTESRLRAILLELQAAGAPPKISGIREAYNVAGALRGEGETQIFLNAAGDAAASITVTRTAAGAVNWGASFSELAEGQTRPPTDTLGWYRLACFLPQFLPGSINLSQSAGERAAAEQDYRRVMLDLGPCLRTRK